LSFKRRPPSLTLAARLKQFRPRFAPQYSYVVGRGGTSKTNQDWLAISNTFFGLTRAPTLKPTVVPARRLAGSPEGRRMGESAIDRYRRHGRRRALAEEAAASNGACMVCRSHQPYLVYSGALGGGGWRA
jgi:hypothetical protein